jgi:hypothetical protein
MPNQPPVIKVSYRNGSYYVDRPNWDGGDVVSLEEIATYIEMDCECLMEIVPGETKHSYGLRLLRCLAAEIRALKRPYPVPAAPESNLCRCSPPSAVALMTNPPICPQCRRFMW